MKLLYVINHMDWFWSHRLPLALAAKAQGYDVTIAAPAAGQDKTLGEKGFHAADLPISNPLAVMLSLRAHVKALKPDVIHAITLKFILLTGLSTFGIGKVRRIYTVAGLGYLFYGDGMKARAARFIVWPWLWLVFRAQSCFVIFQNPDDLKTFQKYHLATGQNSTVILGSGVDINAFPSAPLPENVVPVVLMPTRLIREKGVFVFAQAAKILADKGVQARFIIAGGLSTTNPAAILEAEMEAMMRLSPVEWLGKVDDMPELYAGADLIAYPSWYGEGIPKVLLEAAATGRAIVTTDHPGCREVVENGKNGLLVPVRNALALARAIEVLLDNAPKRQEMGEMSRKLAEEKFKVELVNAATLACYNIREGE